MCVLALWCDHSRLKSICSGTTLGVYSVRQKQQICRFLSCQFTRVAIQHGDKKVICGEGGGWGGDNGDDYNSVEQLKVAQPQDCNGIQCTRGVGTPA